MAGYFNPESFLTVPQFNSLTSPDPGKYVKQFLDHQAAQEELRQSKQLFPLKEQLAQEEVSKIQALVEGTLLQNQDYANSITEKEDYDNLAKRITGYTPGQIELLKALGYDVPTVGKNKLSNLTTDNLLVGNTNLGTTNNPSSNIENLVKQAKQKNNSLDNSTTTNGNPPENNLQNIVKKKFESKEPGKDLNAVDFYPYSITLSDIQQSHGKSSRILEDILNLPKGTYANNTDVAYPVLENGQLTFKRYPDGTTPKAYKEFENSSLFNETLGNLYKTKDKVIQDKDTLKSIAKLQNSFNGVGNSLNISDKVNYTTILGEYVKEVDKNVAFGGGLSKLIKNTYADKDNDKNNYAHQRRLESFLAGMILTLGSNAASFGNKLLPIAEKYIKTGDTIQLDTALAQLSNTSGLGNAQSAREILDDLLVAVKATDTVLQKKRGIGNIITHKNLKVGDSVASIYNLSNDNLSEISQIAAQIKLQRALDKQLKLDRPIGKGNKNTTDLISIFPKGGLKAYIDAY